MDKMMFLAIVSAMAVTQSIFLGILSITKDKRKGGYYFYLGLLFLAIGIRIGKSLFYYYWPEMSIFGVALGGAGLWAIGPSFYLFTRSLYGNKTSHPWLFYTPSIILLLSAPFLNMNNMWYIYFGGALTIPVFLIWALIRFKVYLQKGLQFFVGFLVILSAILVYQLFSDSAASYAIGAFIAAFLLYIINFKGMDQFGLKLNGEIHKSKELDNITLEIKELMDQGYYRQQGLTLDKLALKLDRPSYLVRNAIHHSFSCNFNDFLNAFRINEVARNLETEQLYTIDALGKEAGFTSSSSFYSAFKKVKGCTPKEYRQNRNVMENA